MLRALFEKKGNAVYISHLDLMRVFQRAFKRAGLPLTHTQGFNPRPSVSIALPLSVGIESKCELLDFTLEGERHSYDEICDRLNSALSDGIRILRVYENGRKIRDLARLACTITLEYDNGVDDATELAIINLFSGTEIIVPKKTKNGVQDQNIASMMHEFSAKKISDHEIVIHALISCQNPTLNPMQIPAAISLYLPECKPDFTKCIRDEIYDMENKVFR